VVGRCAGIAPCSRGFVDLQFLETRDGRLEGVLHASHAPDALAERMESFLDRFDYSRVVYVLDVVFEDRENLLLICVGSCKRCELIGRQYPFIELVCIALVICLRRHVHPLLSETSRRFLIAHCWPPRSAEQPAPEVVDAAAAHKQCISNNTT